MYNKKPIEPTSQQYKAIQDVIALHKSGQLELAEIQYKELLNLLPENTLLLNNLGIIASQKGNLEDAIKIIGESLFISPNQPHMLNNLGNIFRRLKRFDEALLNYDRAIAFRSDYEDVYFNRGNLLKDLKRFDEALINYNHAIILQPNHVYAYLNLGNTLQDLKRFEEAVKSYEQVVKLNSEMDFALGSLLYTRMYICIWDDFEYLTSELIKRIQDNKKASIPFAMLVLNDEPEIHRKVSEIYAKEKYPSNILTKISQYPKHDKIHLAYFSADFKNHPVALLTAGLYEFHNRDKFEIHAFSLSSDTNDEVNLRIKAGFDHYHNVHAMYDGDIVKLARDLEIDIAVDLGGYTQHTRAGIFAKHCAPIQVNYLGYPGTMSTPYIDYIIADKILIPKESQKYYSEKIAYLPNSYQANDDKRKISDRIFTKEELGLPEKGFVYCCFNNNYKITPQTFDSWMRILKSVDNSVLWLFEDNVIAAQNLKKEAEKRGVNSNRLIFAKRMSTEDHLARHKLADLFLDTLPYNAHTTCSDALWAGLPVLTLIGQSFASRVAASLLNAVNLPGLITNTKEEYENLTIELATNPEKLKSIKEKLQKNRLTTPLFNTKIFTKHIESAYEAMYNRYQNDLLPDNIEVNENNYN